MRESGRRHPRCSAGLRGRELLESPFFPAAYEPANGIATYDSSLRLEFHPLSLPSLTESSSQSTYHFGSPRWNSLCVSGSGEWSSVGALPFPCCIPIVVANWTASRSRNTTSLPRQPQIFVSGPPTQHRSSKGPRSGGGWTGVRRRRRSQVSPLGNLCTS